MRDNGFRISQRVMELNKWKMAQFIQGFLKMVKGTEKVIYNYLLILYLKCRQKSMERWFLL